MICLGISLWIYFTYYRIQKKTDENYPLESSLMLIQAKYIRLLPSVGYSLLIIPLNSVLYQISSNYDRFRYENIRKRSKKSHRLINLENHRLQTAYENNLTTKIFVVYFMNCFVGLFYEAFFNANYGNVANVSP